jgi:hypothetical protein
MIQTEVQTKATVLLHRLRATLHVVAMKEGIVANSMAILMF